MTLLDILCVYGAMEKHSEVLAINRFILIAKMSITFKNNVWFAVCK